MGTRILVTGGAGYIGSHTAKVLAAEGFEPLSYDDLRTGREDNVRVGRLIRGDIADRERVENILRTERIEAVIHFAASAYVGESMRDPAKYFRNNVVGGLALLDACLAANVRGLVFSSTCATYGVPVRLPIDEEHPQKPVNPYGESKLFFEKALAWFEQCHGLRWVALRYFNAAGADPSGDLDEHHEPETHLLPLTIDAAMRRRGPIEIFGTDYDTPDGTAVRDYIHVCDLADAHVRAVRRLLDGGKSLATNLGTGQGQSVRQVIASVARVTGRDVPMIEAPRRPGDPSTLVADPRRAKAELGWVARYTDIDAIVETAHRARVWRG